jgi:hypothetical protein
MKQFVDAKIEMLGNTGEGSRVRNSRSLITTMLEYGYMWDSNGNIGYGEIPEDDTLSRIEWIVTKSNGIMYRSGNYSIGGGINYKWWDSFLFETFIKELIAGDKKKEMLPRYVNGKIPIFGHEHAERVIKKLFEIGYYWAGWEDFPEGRYTLPPKIEMFSSRWIFVNSDGTMTYTKNHKTGISDERKSYRFVKLPEYVASNKHQYSEFSKLPYKIT